MMATTWGWQQGKGTAMLETAGKYYLGPQDDHAGLVNLAQAGQRPGADQGNVPRPY